MKFFYTALMTKFNATVAGVHNDFWNNIGGRLFQGEASEGTVFPYVILLHINNNQIDTFKNKIDDIVIQFSVFSEKASSVEVHDIMTHLKALFDDCTFTISGGTLIHMFHLNDGPLLREEISGPSQLGIKVIWHYPVDYRAVFERD